MDDEATAIRQAALYLEEKPSPALLAAISEIAEWIAHYEGTYRSSNLRKNHRDALAKIKAAADLLVKRLDRNARLTRTVADENKVNPALVDHEINQMLDWVLAQWVAPEGGLNPKALRALSQGLEVLIRSSGGAGNYRVSDVYGTPRSRMVCATAAVELWTAVHGERPGRSNTTLHEFCEALWAITQEGDLEGGRWERPLRDVLKGLKGADLSPVVGGQVATAHRHIRSILNKHRFSASRT
jgi:hypothetical protein